ncbi:hypothetical protein MTP99_017103 [Tenebrio molitor]|jgi:hypothetical protein|nr:hypothetical protein MTP99_017103 [Tenebrio molitor]CAH1375698.1 unnamed protein product [Tenebrio molitor]
MECRKKFDTSLTTCDSLRTYALHCSQPFIQLEDECLTNYTKGLTMLTVKGIVSAIDFLCSERGEVILELVNPCIWFYEFTAEEQEPEEELEECNDRLKDMIHKYRKNLPSPSEACSSLGTFWSCFNSRLTRNCKNPKTKEAVSRFYDAFVTPCNDIKGLM